MPRPTLTFLHALGASAREWDYVVASLPDMDCIALDLPGFGERASDGYVDVAAMTDWLANEVRARDIVCSILVGHSMGGKIATLVAARAQAGDEGLSGIKGIVLVAASPPCPEPMEDTRRAEMIAWCADGQISAADAQIFVSANTVGRLPPAMQAQALADVQRSSRKAWVGWLECGSLEDWSDRAGLIEIPALILAGAEDGDLDAPAQWRLNLPHFHNARVEVIADAAHLIPYEQPRALAAAIMGHVMTLTG